MINVKDIYKLVSQKEIMEYYYGCSIIDRKPIYRNVTRSDSNGSCAFFHSASGNYYLNDFAKGTMHSCIDVVQSLYNLSFTNAKLRIISDFNLETYFGIPSNNSSTIKLRQVINNQAQIKQQIFRRRNYQVVVRGFNNTDLAYWKKFNISEATLQKYKVYAVDSYKIENFQTNKFESKYKYFGDIGNMETQNLCYVYLLKSKSGVTKVKLYEPFSKTNKWCGNTSTDDIYGLDQIPINEDLSNEAIYITSGLKDLMALSELGLWGIAPNSEGYSIKDELIDYLKSKFKKVVFLYDNDLTGIQMSLKHSIKHKCSMITLPVLPNRLRFDKQSKDVADYSRILGKFKLKTLILSLTNNTYHAVRNATKRRCYKKITQRERTITREYYKQNESDHPEWSRNFRRNAIVEEYSN